MSRKLGNNRLSVRHKNISIGQFVQVVTRGPDY